MLSMLIMTPEKTRGPVARRWRRIFPPPVTAYLDTVGNTPYIRIMCEEHPKGVDWRMVAAHSLECSGRLLIPSGMECPAEYELHRFTPAKFVRRMMENFALETLISMQQPPAQRSAALYGSEAEIIQLLPQLTPLVGSLRIISRRGYALTDVVEDIMAKTGMTVTVTDQPDAGDCRLLLAPFGGAGYVRAGADTAVIAPDRPASDCAAWINGVKVSVPAVLEPAYNEQFDPLEFTAAFYELAGMRELGRVFPDCGLGENGSITAAELAQILS